MRRVPAGTKWHPAKDSLAGTEVYGVPFSSVTDWKCNDIGDGWSINFESAVPGYDEFLFATGDAQRWVITTKDAVGGPLVSPSRWYENEPRTVLKSSDRWYGPSYEVQWYNRNHVPEDPWISIIDHIPAISANKIVYGEGSFAAHDGQLLHHKGANVFIRKAPSRPACPSEFPYSLPSAPHVCYNDKCRGFGSSPAAACTHSYGNPCEAWCTKDPSKEDTSNGCGTVCRMPSPHPAPVPPPPPPPAHSPIAASPAMPSPPSFHTCLSR